MIKSSFLVLCALFVASAAAAQNGKSEERESSSSPFSEQNRQEIDPNADSDIAKDPRFIANQCRLGGNVFEGGVCRAAGFAPEILFGSEPAYAGQFHNTVALSIIKRDDAGALLTDVNGDPLTTVCSGTLIAPTLVLTARHCAEPNYWGDIHHEIDEAVFGLDMYGSSERIGVRDCADFGQTTYKSCKQSRERPSNRDLILVRLAEAAPSFPARLAPTDMIDSASGIIAVGFGKTDKLEIGKKYYTRKPLAVVSGRCNGVIEGKSDETRFGCTPDVELVAGRGKHQDGNPETDTCGGDSGGTLYVTDPAAGTNPVWPYDYFLAAVTSRATSNSRSHVFRNGEKQASLKCGDGGVYVRVDGAVAFWLGQHARNQGAPLLIGRQ